MMRNKMKAIAQDPYRILGWIITRYPFPGKLIPDRMYLSVLFRCIFGRKLNLENPKSFNEKLQWLKLYAREPIYTTMVDKYEVKKHVIDIIGEGHIIPTLGIWERFEDIDFETLPDKFVLKCTHDSGGLVVCRDKASLDIDAAHRKINKCLKKNFYWEGREWPYRSVKPRIIAEQYMEDTDKPGELTDYKIHCFNGEPKIVQVITDRFLESGMINDHYTLDWEKLDLVRGNYAASDKSVPKPPEIDEMLKLAKILCQGTYYVRTDFYIIANHVYFGEITFFPAAGFTSFRPDEWDDIWGEWIKLPTDK